MKTERLTTAQAVVKYLTQQFIETDDETLPLFPGAFAIFGHGSVTCMGEALEAVQDVFPTWRGQNEQSMALAAIAFAKAKRRRQIMVANSSIGPGATNMLTAAALAHTNRLPVLFLAGDTFVNRRPDPVLQQTEHFGNPSITVNDAFKPLVRYWDRIVHPEQIISSLPQAVATMLDPGDCGPAFIALPQDIQEIAWDFPAAFFERKINVVPRQLPDERLLQQAVHLFKNAKRPLIIAGGGVRYSFAETALGHFARQHNIPVVETIAGKGTLTHNHPNHIGPLGIMGASSANACAAEADVVLAVGTRLQDFTTGSWSVFQPETKFISINAARYDATKHQALALVGDALRTLQEIERSLAGWRIEDGWIDKARERFAVWNEYLDGIQNPPKGKTPSYAQVVGVVNNLARDEDVMVTAAGGLPGETVKNWRVKAPNTYDCEFGFSCMGYEIAGGLGIAMANPDRDVFVMVGDGSYMMMNSEIYTAALTGHKMIVVLCDNGGYGVINRLQIAKGNRPFNNLIQDCRIEQNFAVDYVAHARAMGADARRVESIEDLPDAIRWAQQNNKTSVVYIETDPHNWSAGDAWWDVGVPQISNIAAVEDAARSQQEGRKKQRVGV